MPCNTCFYNKGDNSYHEVYSILVNGDIYYFLDEFENKKYIFKNVNKEKIENIISNYIPEKDGNVMLLKGQKGYLKYKEIEYNVKKVKKQLHILTRKLSYEEYIYEAFKTIEKILLTEKNYTSDFKSGIECLDYLLRLFIGGYDNIEKKFLRNINDNSHAEVFVLSVNGIFYYFIYELINNQDNFREISKDYIDSNYNTILDEQNILKKSIIYCK